MLQCWEKLKSLKKLNPKGMQIIFLLTKGGGQWEGERDGERDGEREGERDGERDLNGDDLVDDYLDSWGC